MEHERCLEIDGPEAPPRKNGELIFEAPWESRAFGITHTLCDAGHFTWDDFRRHLIARIGAWERAHVAGAPYRYYEHWLGALEDVLAERDLCAKDLIDLRERVLAARPAGHDHDHGP